jgi:protein-S-isoprenylcysteine O-methyltransferase Ste14
VSPSFAKAAVLIASVVLVAIRAPHGQRSRGIPVVESRRGGRETALLTVAWVSFFLPLLWLVTPLLDVAELPLRPLPYSIGLALYALGLWLFWHSHADLGPAWSITLELREGQRLVTHGVYRSLRHPMYLGLLLHGAGQALVLPNWIAGPSYLLAMTSIVVLRLGPEERMLREAFGAAYEEYAGRTKRLVPGLW